MKASLGAHFNIPSLSLNGWLVSISACICPIARWEGSSANSLNEGRIEKTLGDGAYDRKELFNELEKRGILSGIKMRKDAATKSRGSPYRSECVRRRNKIDYDKWAEETGYGMRWKGFIRA